MVLAVLHTVCLKTVTSLDITSKLFHVQFAQMCEVFQGVFYFPCKCSCRRDPKSKIAKTKKFSYLKRSLATVSGCLGKQVSSIVPSFIHYAFLDTKDCIYLYRCSQSDGTKQCLPWWFGSDCKAHCIPHDDDDNGHYSCAREGNKTCHDGWHGENCTVFCIPQDDDIRGHYTCDEEGSKVCLNGYRSPDCMDCLLGLYGANCSLSCLVNDTYGFQQGYIYCSDDGVKQCKKWWHGPECLQYCVPHDDNEHGHYMCEPRDGSKVCRPGWEGLSCLNRKKN